jgi:hypothetical protein
MTGAVLAQLLALGLAIGDSTAAATVPAPALARPLPAGVQAALPDTEPPRRPKAVEYSDAYGTRLTIHRWGSYVMLPLFAAQYVLGEKLLQQKDDVFAGRRGSPPDDDLRTAHAVVAGGVGLLFVTNTVTGVWNYAEARHDPEGKTLRTVHGLTMLISEAGFVATGVKGHSSVDGNPDDARAHRNIALASVGVAVVGAGMMWILNRH